MNMCASFPRWWALLSAGPDGLLSGRAALPQRDRRDDRREYRCLPVEHFQRIFPFAASVPAHDPADFLHSAARPGNSRHLGGNPVGRSTGALMQGSGLSALMRAAKEGYAGTTGNSMVDRLLTAGGLDAMMPSISLIIIAMMFGGILEKSGQMRALTAPVMRLVHSLTGLTGAVVLTSILSNITMPDQYVAVALPGRMFRGEYDRQSIDRRKAGDRPFGRRRSLPRHWCRGTPAAASWRECWGFRPSPMHSMPFLTFPCRYWPCWPWRQPPARDGFYSNKEVKQHDEADRSRAAAAAGNGTDGTAARCAPARPDNAGAGLWGDGV